MDNDVKTKNNEEIAHFLNASDRMIKGIDVLRKKNRPLLNGHRYLTDDELSRLLHINRRTLQDYRNMGRISFVKLGGKVLYREEDVEKLLQENYRPRFEKPWRRTGSKKHFSYYLFSYSVVPSSFAITHK